jgi:hypothetical protein
LPQVRRLYGYRCGYCGVSEADTGGELTVDHHRPVAAAGEDSDENLVYACVRCNLYKGDFFPSGDDLTRGRRVLHPLLDVIEAHVRADDHTGHLHAVTETGRFHITLLHLNRPALVEHRLWRRLHGVLAAERMVLEAEVDQLQARVTALEAEVELLRRLLRRPPHES